MNLRLSRRNAGALAATLLCLTASWTAGCSPASPPATATALSTASASRSDLSMTDAAPAAHVRVRIVAFNDFHGNLLPPAGSHGVVFARRDDPVIEHAGPALSDGGVATEEGASTLAALPVGGAAYLAAHVRRLRAEGPSTIVVSAGDLTGASPLVSALFADEPTVLVMNSMGLDFEGIGNHDFDHGLPELQRRQKGGCEFDGCDAGAFEGARFQILGANVVDDIGGRPIFAPYAIREVSGARIAFIGETLANTPSTTTPSAVRGLRFTDEADTANALVPELAKQGVSAIVLVLHQGGQQSASGTYDSCDGLTGDILPIVAKLSPAIQVVISGHTHQAYDCVLGDHLVTSAASYGRLLTVIDLVLDPAAHRVLEKQAHNVPVTRDIAPDEAVERIVATYQERARGVADRVVGYVARDVTGSAKIARAPSCETPLGDVIADAMRAATHADLAFMNPGGIRADLVAQRPGRPPGEVTFGDAAEVQPFGNRLVTVTLTGAQIRQALEHQFRPNADPRILQVSRDLAYRYAFDREKGEGAISDLRLRGRQLTPDAVVQVTLPSFLQEGGDGFTVFREGRDPLTGPVDVDALVAYLTKTTSHATPLDPKPASRIQGDGCVPLPSAR